jgi:hypothetical protein
VKRNFARVLTLLTGVLVPVLTAAAPALAIHRDDGEVPGKPLGTGLTIVYYVIIPLGAFLVISALAVLPSTLARPRYRPGKPWDHNPLSFGKSSEDAGEASGTARGGASGEW